MELLSFSDGIDGAAETSVWLLLSSVCIYIYIHTYVHDGTINVTMYIYIHTYIHDGTISVQSHCEKVMLNYIPFTHKWTKSINVTMYIYIETYMMAQSMLCSVTLSKKSCWIIFISHTNEPRVMKIHWSVSNGDCQKEHHGFYRYVALELWGLHHAWSLT